MRRFSGQISFALFLALYFALQARAQTENALAAPNDVVATMQSSGVSLTFASLPASTGSAPAWAHLYVVPPKGASPLGTPKGTPITRDDVGPGSTIPTSPYYLDVFTRRNDHSLERRAAILFTESGACNQLKIRWLESNKKRGLVLLLRFGVGDEGVWRVYALSPTFTVLSRQVFGFVGDAEDYYLNPRFDQNDRRGLMAIVVDEREGKRKQTIHYEWNETAFVDKKASYFLLSAASRKRSEVEEYAAKHKLEEYEIVSTDAYKRLTPGLYALVLARFQDKKQAETLAKSRNKDGIECYVKKAF